KEELDYLEYIVSSKGITPSAKKLDAIIKYPAPKNVKQLSSFLDLASSYRKLIRAFADKAHPLTALTRKSAEWKLGEEQRDAFECIKNCLITRPVLGYPDFSREFIIYTDASGYAIGEVLAQIKPPPQSADLADEVRLRNMAERESDSREEQHQVNHGGEAHPNQEERENGEPPGPALPLPMQNIVANPPAPNAMAPDVMLLLANLLAGSRNNKRLNGSCKRRKRKPSQLLCVVWRKERERQAGPIEYCPPSVRVRKMKWTTGFTREEIRDVPYPRDTEELEKNASFAPPLAPHYEETIRMLTTRVERLAVELKQLKNDREHNRNIRQVSSPHQQDRQPGRSQSSISKCFRCGKEGHMVRNCPYPGRFSRCGSSEHEQQDCRNDKRVCFRCGMTRHLINECPSMKRSAESATESPYKKDNRAGTVSGNGKDGFYQT
ncbi:Uncharacterized protein APZ42_029229, partial [Daphnia magna]